MPSLERFPVLLKFEQMTFKFPRCFWTIFDLETLTFDQTCNQFIFVPNASKF